MPLADLGEWNVYYEERGAGTSVLLISDLGEDHRAWARQTGALAERFRVVVLDNPGVGRTEGPRGSYTTALFADVAAGLLRHLAIERAHVVGASMGGAVAQELALRYPELVRSLALHCTWGRADRHLTAILRSWQTADGALPPLDFRRQVWPFVFTVWWYNDRPAELERLEQQAAETPQSADAFCAQAEACIHHDALDRFGEIEAPTLLTVGDRDVLTPAHHTYAIKDAMPDARVRVWQKMGHAPFWEIPEQFNEVTINWIKEH